MIIDFHTHVFPDRIAIATVEALKEKGNIPAHSDGTVGALIERMKESGVDISLNLPVLTKDRQFDGILKFAKELSSTDFGEKRIISFAGIHPDCEDFEEKLAAVKEAGFLGIKIHPDYQGVFFDDERYVRILAEAKRLDLITVTHAGYDVGFPDEPIKCTPRRAIRLLEKIGGYDKLVLAHMGGNQLFSEVYDILAGEKVYFDTAYVLPFFDTGEFNKMIEKHGEDRILFASDSPWQNQKSDVERLRSFSFGKATEEKIFSANAKKLLKI